MEVVTERRVVSKDKIKRSFFIDTVDKSFSLIFHFEKNLFLVVWTSLRISLIAVFIASIIAVPLGILVALKLFPGRGFLLSILNTLMALPTVIVGLLLYGLLNRQGVLGEFGLLYTPAAMVMGQSILIIPIIWNLSIAAVNGADPRLRSTCLSLGANLYQQGLIYINEVRFALMAAIVAGFGRAIGEVGVAMMLGGNIAGFTRTMTTAIALETSKGEFEFALALGMMLLLVALAVNIVLQQFQELKQ
ncbi:MAG: ABC transporter permease [Gammaproteobacteria bacterium]|nr:ABC transporter permease [Gammaproteobacteria bacterium]